MFLYVVGPARLARVEPRDDCYFFSCWAINVFEALQDARDRQVLGEQVLLNLFGLLQYRLGVLYVSSERLSAARA